MNYMDDFGQFLQMYANIDDSICAACCVWVHRWFIINTFFKTIDVWDVATAYTYVWLCP